jgi:uncharacterized membrane protein
MIGSSIGAAHLTAAVAALALGLIVLCVRKGDDLHRLFGLAFVLAMVAVNATALAIFRLTGQFNPFHALALLSLATTLSGVIIVMRRQENWMAAHLRMMFFSYVSLLAAAITEGLFRSGLLRSLGSNPTAIVATGLVIAAACAAGAYWSAGAVLKGLTASRE